MSNENSTQFYSSKISKIKKILFGLRVLSTLTTKHKFGVVVVHGGGGQILTMESVWYLVDHRKDRKWFFNLGMDLLTPAHFFHNTFLPFQI